MHSAGTPEDRAIHALSRCRPGGGTLSDFAIRMNLKYAVKRMANLEHLADTEAQKRLLLADEIEALSKAGASRRRLSRVFLLAAVFFFFLPPAATAVYLLTDSTMKGWSVFLVLPVIALTFLVVRFLLLRQARIIFLRQEILLAGPGYYSGRELSQIKIDLRPWIEEGYILEGPIRLGKV